jgi:ribosome biogenesis GTP-binding protein YsxC/EngB
MNIQSAELQASAPDFASCPPPALPEYAVIGRSNVGKSSLINMLTRRNGLARVSATPGKTKLIHFYTINKRWTLVDLPGYGYAKAGKAERLRFDRLISGYLSTRPTLRCTFVLIDSRLEPQEIDLAFIRWMVGKGLPLALVFTKADKLSKTAAQKAVGAFLERMKDIAEDDPITLITSSRTGTGRSEMLRLIMDSLAEEETA